MASRLLPDSLLGILQGGELTKDVYRDVLILITGFSAIYVLGLVTYRLLLSPLARFPGPKLAAATSWYEAYYDVVKKGKFIFEIEKMHDKYGPIVRINPHELSIRDPEYYDKLYVAGSVRPTDNYLGFANGLDLEGSHLLSTSHELHRKRRKPLEPFFSRLGVTRLEPMVAEVTENLIVKRFESFKGSGKIVRLDHAFLAYAGDVVGRICMDNPRNLVEDPEFAPDYFNLFHTVIKSLPLFLNFPWLIQLIQLIPEHILLKLDPRSQEFNKFRLMSESHIDEAKREKAASGSKDTSLSGPVTIFRHLVNSDLPASELTRERLSKESQVLLGAGTVSTARTLDFISYYIMANPAIRKRLTEELRHDMAGYPEKKPTWAQLEKLPYLQALIKEGLRLSYGVMHRLPRVSPHQALQFKEWVIPPGVPVSMSAYLQHTNPEIYPRPYEFIPERWLENVTPLMTKNYVPFAKGSRNCLGMNLVYCELNFVLAALFRPGGPDFELYETDESDIAQVHDLVIPLPKLDTKGVRTRFN
ncbi:cytochrome P450 family protein [Xylaria bambusicola]|uniref:cytochrome P450 family protein n=1 Tax=Xylaria bambusicola TaxID=326684 RepID=UPI002007C59F|nr:cytochrome P450 family protein [Xylaria bambusicola]KAI0526193.1 cytochrome P450 family protein [Xylaria bambusicola]